MMNLRQINVLNILWGTEESMTSADIVNKMKDLTQSTVIAVLRRLVTGGYIEVTGVTYCGKVLSRTYRPTEKSREMLMKQFVTGYEKFVNIIPVSEMCAAILRTDQEPEQLRKELGKLKSMLEELNARGYKNETKADDNPPDKEA